MTVLGSPFRYEVHRSNLEVRDCCDRRHAQDVASVQRRATIHHAGPLVGLTQLEIISYETSRPGELP